MKISQNSKQNILWYWLLCSGNKPKLKEDIKEYIKWINCKVLKSFNAINIQSALAEKGISIMQQSYR